MQNCILNYIMVTTAKGWDYKLYESDGEEKNYNANRKVVAALELS